MELYFCKLLKKHTTNDIIYMYSIRDTPASFVTEINAYVTQCIGYDDNEITYNVNFKSHYASFNTLRTCNFIFAYNLEQYEKVCIIESDMVIMQNIDSIFDLNAPSIVYYAGGDSNLNTNQKYSIRRENVFIDCKTTSHVNGGVLLIQPSRSMFEEYKTAIPLIADRECKYPNEALFEYMNPVFYNLPVRYNLSHYHTLRLNKYKMRPSDVLVYHFNETEFKHLDIIKDNWIPNMEDNPKYEVKKIPVKHFNNKIYIPYHDEINNVLARVEEHSRRQSAPAPAPLTVSAPVSAPVPAPVSAPVPAPVPAPVTVTAPVPVKSVWTKLMSKKYGREYWFNDQTGESVWEEPKDYKGGRKTKNRKSRHLRKSYKKKSMTPKKRSTRKYK